MKEALVALEGSVPLALLVLIVILLNHREMNRLFRRVIDLESSLRAEMNSIRNECCFGSIPLTAKSR